MNAILISAVFLAAMATPPADGSRAPDFALQTPEGKTVRLSELVADGPVVLVVLRGWTGTGEHCPACVGQAAELLARRQDITRHAKHIVLVYPGAANDLGRQANDFLAATRPKMSQLPKPVTLVLDPDYSMIKQYGLRWDAPQETAYPSTMVIDGDGIVRWSKTSRTHKGRATATEVIAALRSLER